MLLLVTPLAAAVLAIAGCAPDEQEEVPAPQPLVAQPAAQGRVGLEMIPTPAAPASRWGARVVAVYDPLDTDAEGATVTTTSYDNCPRQTGVVFVPVPPLFPCTRSYDRHPQIELSRQQITLAGEQGLNIDFDPVIEDGGAKFLIRSLSVELKPCESGCEIQSLDVDIGCWEEPREPDIVADTLRITYSAGAEMHPAARHCGLKQGDWPGWYTRSAVMPRIRGRFGETEQGVSGDLLEKFSAIPKRDGGWLANPTYGLSSFHDFCPLAGRGGYDRLDLRTKLGPEQGWPYDPDVELIVFRQPEGGLCAIWIDGTHQRGEYTDRVRYFYEFAAGRLVQIRTEEPEDVERTWRYVDGAPMEYIREQSHDSVAGGEEILYWHRLAAEEWPQHMDFTPDATEFEAQATYAMALAERFGKLPSQAE